MWQSIDTAPKNGTPVDLWLVDVRDGIPENAHRCTDAAWIDGAWRHDVETEDYVDAERHGFKASHWMFVEPPSQCPQL